MVNVVVFWVMFVIDVIIKIKFLCLILFVYVESNWVLIVGNDWCKLVMIISEYVFLKIFILINLVVLYS